MRCTGLKPSEKQWNSRCNFAMQNCTAVAAQSAECCFWSDLLGNSFILRETAQSIHI
ncbi:hypothetical protein LMG27952_04906 [Paraburkholderia hiiakae]|uniref:Uncharacterized protein n=1 Tax=Paraburkholderia hiiakae TaxID=1081782 RepID=A0ABM8NYP6_9BURK|nr:hypothetical protein LMG27952_04906 [Paraburkholderia hiiakae]